MSKKIFITGASGGFGALTTKSLLAQGHQVVGTMRSTSGKNAEVASELKAAGAVLVEMDITEENEVNRAVEEAIESLGGLDVLINNAGVGVLGMQEHFTPEDMQYIFDVNIFGTQRVMRAALPYLRGQGHGLVLFTSSLLGRITLPFYGIYNASKWALEAIAENYRTELSQFGIECCIVEPGGYPTTFMDNLKKPSDSSRVEAYGEFMNAPGLMFENFEKALESNPEQRPQKVADAIVELVDIPSGEKPMRTVVDHMGMGTHVVAYNTQLDQMTHGIYSAFGIEGMLKVKS
ncbi:SDR family oxidoreductase [Poritiphilus flavus]|uniref:SDR family NAD(P)-dependent oxidoreductase n=1 Tax=Poritiphilus flavus TaxID=2697053 RepID=A0A6L9EGZ0_9FLAO|nr:SDR family oxidoreductase [Poritiphilus flavus]NAS13965.1 SDR family NAD(P)-dependent oxidoreductase [Poritiphilus flavus]